MRRRRKEGPWRDRLRGLRAGAIVLALPIPVMLVLQAADAPDFLMALAYFALAIPGFGVALVWSEGSLLRLFAGALLMLAAPFAAFMLPEARLAGLVVTTTPEEAPAHPLAAALRLPGAAPDAARERTVEARYSHRPRDMRGYRGAPVTRQGTFLVAPVLPHGAAPDGPVRAVAVQRLDEAAPRPLSWAPEGGLLKLLPDALVEVAVRQAMREAGLALAPDAVIGTWSGSQAGALLEAATPVLLAYAAALLAWLLLLLLPGAPRLPPAPRQD